MLTQPIRAPAHTMTTSSDTSSRPSYFDQVKSTEGCSITPHFTVGTNFIFGLDYLAWRIVFRSYYGHPHYFFRSTGGGYSPDQSFQLSILNLMSRRTLTSTCYLSRSISDSVHSQRTSQCRSHLYDPNSNRGITNTHETWQAQLNGIHIEEIFTCC